jgi:hypothetical protein
MITLIDGDFTDYLMISLIISWYTLKIKLICCFSKIQFMLMNSPTVEMVFFNEEYNSRVDSPWLCFARRPSLRLRRKEGI